MRHRFLIALALLLLGTSLQAQRRNRRSSTDDWPPERNYARTSLGSALQDIYARHFDFCGFGKRDRKRDYTPPSIADYLGKRSLRTPVEKANISGGNLLNYVFTEAETGAPFDRIHFQGDKLLFANSTGINLNPQPVQGFDAYFLNSTCGGYLNASLEAGLEPPYAAVKAGLQADHNKNSVVAAVAGEFISPLTEIIHANDSRTTELYANIWTFYQQNPAYVDKAYYLARFDGTLVKHLTTAESITNFERSVGLNVAVPLAGKIASELSITNNRGSNFSGTDWESIIYTDFNGPYQREALFARLPTVAQIQQYFRYQVGSSSLTTSNVSPLREGGLHTETITITGLPTQFKHAGWFVDGVQGGAFRGKPRVQVEQAGNGSGLTLSLTATAAKSVFTDGKSSTFDLVPVQYELVAPARQSMPELRIPVSQRLPVSSHPVLRDASSRMEIRREDSEQFSFRWYVTIPVMDAENPLAEGNVGVRNIRAGFAEEVLDCRLIDARYNKRNRLLDIVIQTERTWELAHINNRYKRNLPLALTLALPTAGGYEPVIRNVKTSIAVPTIRVPQTAPLGN